jgi:TetR/AcrR family transcriptional repressor of nem operon
MLNRTSNEALPDTKCKLVQAGAKLMRSRGYNATTVDEICADAGVTKGGFFHYFKSKDDLAKAAVTQFFDNQAVAYKEAPFRGLADPLARVYGRLDYVEQSGGGKGQTTKGCLIGVFAQELAFTNPEIRDLCQDFFSRMGRDFACDLAEARAAHAPEAKFDPKALAQLYVAIVQGSLLLAKTAGNNDVLIENLEQFRAYLKTFFSSESGKGSGQSIR